MRHAMLTLCFGLLLLVLPWTGPRGVDGQPPMDTPFTLDVPLTDNAATFYLGGDTFSTLSAGSPFYQGQVAPPGQQLSAYNQARARKVREVIAEADALMQSARALAPMLDRLRAAECDTLCAVQEDPAFAPFVTECLTALTNAQAARLVADAAYATTQVTAAGSLARAQGSYLRVTRARLAAVAYLREIDVIAKTAVITYQGCKNGMSFSAWEAGNTLDAAMAALTRADASINTVVRRLQRVAWGLRQLETGDYYYARAATGFLAAQAPMLRKKLAAAKARGPVTTRDLQFTGEYLRALTEMNTGLTRRLNQADPQRLVPVRVAAHYPPDCAIAAGNPPAYAKACASVSAPVAPPAAQPGVSSKWETVKAGASAAWQGARWAGQTGQRTVQFTADSLGAYTRSWLRVPCGIWAGNTADQIMTDMSADIQEIYDDWNGRLPEQSVLKDADNILGYLDDTAEWAGRSTVGRATGDGWTNWAAGKLTRAAVGLFTGLGRGISKIADPRSTNAELASGTLDIVCSAIGGSKILIKGSAVALGSAQGARGMHRLFGEYLTQRLAQQEMRALKNQIKDELGRNTLDQARVLNLRQLILGLEEAEVQAAANYAALKNEMRNQLLEALQQAPANTASDARKNLAEFYRTYLKREAGTLGEQLEQIVGRNGTELFDNLIGEVVDDLIQNRVEQALTPPSPWDVLKGNWAMRFDMRSQHNVQVVNALQMDALRYLTSGEFFCELAMTPDADPHTGAATMRDDGLSPDPTRQLGTTLPMHYRVDAAGHFTTYGKFPSGDTTIVVRLSGTATPGTTPPAITGTLKLSILDKYIIGRFTATKKP